MLTSKHIALFTNGSDDDCTKHIHHNFKWVSHLRTLHQDLCLPFKIDLLLTRKLFFFTEIFVCTCLAMYRPTTLDLSTINSHPLDLQLSTFHPSKKFFNKKFFHKVFSHTFFHKKSFSQTFFHTKQFFTNVFSSQFFTGFFHKQFFTNVWFTK